MVAAGAVGLATGGSAAADSSPGVGSSYAQGFQVTPHEGSLAVGAVFDEALAGHTDKIARAQSQGLDLGAIGTSLQGYNCGQPPSQLATYVPVPLQAETPSNGGSVDQSAGPSPQENNSDGSVEHVVATDTPYGEADTTFAGPLAGPNSFVSISGVVSKAWSGLVNGARTAGASVDIHSLTIAGVITLSGLHWDVNYPSGGGGQPSSSFQIGKALINGTSVPTADPSTVVNTINGILGKVGIEIDLPTSSSANGIQFESPLQIQVVPSQTRDSITDGILTGPVAQVYGPLANALENGFAGAPAPYNSLAPLEAGSNGSQLQQALCNSDTPITVLDVTMASFTAGGFFNIAVGGVNASSGDLPVNPFNLAEFSFGSLSSNSSQLLGGTAAVAGTPALAGTPAQGLTGGTPAIASSGGTAPRSVTQRQVPAAKVSSEAAGPLLGVGLAVLGLLALLAEADRRVMRRSVANATFEE